MKKPIKKPKIIKKFLYFSNSIGMIHTFKNWILIPLSAFGFLDFRKGYFMKLKNGIIFKVIHIMDTLIINEIFNNNDYKIYKLKNHSTIIDIGANIGVFSIYAANKNKTSKIFAFEPSQKTYNQLVENINLNGFENSIIPIKNAVGGKSGKIKLYDMGISGQRSVYKTRGEKKFESVKIIALKDIFIKNNIKKCDLLKIDCEGAEYDILNNCPDDVFKNIKKITMEFHELIPEQNHNLLLDLLKLKGFKVKHWYHSIENDIGYIYARK